MAEMCGYAVPGTLEQWIAKQESPEQLHIVRLVRTVNGRQQEGPRAAVRDGNVLAEERNVREENATVVIPALVSYPLAS